jgi:MipA family protein
MKARLRTTRWAFCAAAMHAGVSARAQEGLPPPSQAMTGDIEATVGLLAAYGPEYLGYQWSDQSPWQLGVRLTFDRGRDEDDSDALRGMGDIPTRVEAGGFIGYRLAPGLMLQTALRYGSGDDRKGLLWDAGLRYMRPLGSGHRIGAGLTATYANQEAIQSQFGVTAAQSITSGYRPYAPGAGLRDVVISASYGYALSPRMVLITGMGYRRLMGDARGSPIVRSDGGTSVNVGLVFQF